MTEPLLVVNNLNVSYEMDRGRLPAVHDVAFQVEPGQILGLVGESGCGKSTVAAALLRILPSNAVVTGGSIRFKGTELLDLGEEEMRKIRGGGIAMVFQDPLSSLNPTMTIGRQLTYVASSHKDRLKPKQVRHRAIELLAEVGIPDPAQRFDDYPHQFSGGMRQRIMIAMALMLEPAVLIADEATSALDVTLQAQILETLRRLQESHGTAIVLVSHDMGVIAETCDRVIVMYAGRVVEEAETTALFDEPQHPYTKALLASIPSLARRGQGISGIPGVVPSLEALPKGCKFSERCFHSQPTCDLQEPGFYGDNGHLARCYLLDPASGVTPRVTAADRDPVEHPVVVAAPQSGPGPLVVVRGLSTYFQSRSGLVGRLFGRTATPIKAVDQVDLEIEKGEVLGLVGESGSGKTTLGLSILRLTRVTAGHAVIAGTDINAMNRRKLRAIRRRIQMIFQDPMASLSPRMRIDRLLTEPYRINQVPPADQYTVRELMELVQLSSEHAVKYPHQLSSGQARRVGIARALAMRPDLVVADEPTAGLDVSAAANVLTLMDRLRTDLGLTYIVISHDLNVVSQIADRIAVMYLGRIVEIGAVGSILDTPFHPYTQGLLAAVPQPHPRAERRDFVPPGEVPSPLNPPTGCQFHPRCRIAQELCKVDSPALEEATSGHQVACHYWNSAVARQPQSVSLSGRRAPINT